MNLSPDGQTLILLPPRTGARVAWRHLAPHYAFPPHIPLTHAAGAPPGAYPRRVVLTTREPYARMVSCWVWTARWPPSHPEADAVAQAARRSFTHYLAHLAEHPGMRPAEIAHYARTSPAPIYAVRYAHQAHDLTRLTGAQPTTAPRHGSPHTHPYAVAQLYANPTHVTLTQTIWPNDTTTPHHPLPFPSPSPALPCTPQG